MAQVVPALNCDDLAGWTQGGNIHGEKYDVFTREFNGHWLAVQKAPRGSLMWWGFIDGNPLGGKHAEMEDAMRACIREALDECDFKDERGLKCRRIAGHAGAHHV